MPVGLRERKKEQTRDALARAVLRLASRKGFDQVTVEEIADACEVSPRTFFRYFASKEDALFADTEARCELLLTVIDEQPPGTSPFEAVAVAVREVGTRSEDERRALRARDRIVRGSPSLRGRTAERQQGWESAVVERLRERGLAGDLSDLELRLVVAATMVALRVALETWIAEDGTELSELVEAALARLRAGLPA